MSKYIKCISGTQMAWEMTENGKKRVIIDATDAIGYIVKKENSPYECMLYKDDKVFMITSKPTFTSEPILFWKDNAKYKDV